MIEQLGLGRRLRSVRFVLLACVAALCLMPRASVGQEGGGYQNLDQADAQTSTSGCP
jgi:hypothetical protein